MGMLCSVTMATAQTLKTEHFDRDPNWDALNNRAAKPVIGEAERA